jgi:hypothetical protein
MSTRDFEKLSCITGNLNTVFNASALGISEFSQLAELSLSARRN